MPGVIQSVSESSSTSEYLIQEPQIQDNPQQAWAELEAEVASCTLCGLCQTRTQTVFGTGNKQADWLVIGEAPGQSEDEQGKPFVGKAGTTVDRDVKGNRLGTGRGVYLQYLKMPPTE